MLKIKHKGTHGELKAVLWLLENGYDVYRNVSSHGAIDVIAVKDCEVLFLDVKSSSGAFRTEEQKKIGVKLLYPLDSGGYAFSERDRNANYCMSCGREIVKSRHKQKCCSLSCRAKLSAIERKTQREIYYKRVGRPDIGRG